MSAYLPYPKYKPSGVEWLGDLPEHWKAVPFKWQIERNDGGVWGDDPDGTSDTIVLRSTEQTVDGHWKLDDPAPRKLSISEINATLLIEGDLLVTKSSGSSSHIGKTTLVTREIEEWQCCYSNFMQRIRTAKSFVPKIAWYVMNNDLARLQFDLLSNSSTGLSNLSGTIVGQIMVPVAPLPEQGQIAAFLDRECGKLNILQAKQERLIELLKEKRQSLISHAVTRGLDHAAPLKSSGIESIGKVPEHWDLRPLATVCKFEPGKAHEPFIDDEGSFVCVNSRFVSTGGASRKSCTKNLTPAKKSDILMVMSDLPNGRALARAYFVTDEQNLAVNQRVCILRATDAFALPRYLFFIVNRNPGLLRYDDGVNQTHLSNAAFTKLRIPMPPIAEQHTIVAHLDEKCGKIDQLKAKAERAIRLIKEHRSALICAAVTGKIDVRNA